MGRKKSKLEREARKKALKCPRCKGKEIASKEYSDAILHICLHCQYPWRVTDGAQSPSAPASGAAGQLPALTVDASESRLESALARLQAPRWWEGGTDG